MMRKKCTIQGWGVAVLLGVLSLSSAGFARSSFLTLARAKYPFISGTRLDSCLLCHTSATDPNAGNVNDYGSDFLSNGTNKAAFGRIETLNSDADQFGNLQEIFARTFPGNAADQPSPPANQVDVVAAGTSWKYLDNGSNAGTAWRDRVFDDSLWLSGLAQLGYGNVGEVSVVSFGPSSSNKYITTYFRHSFSRPSTSVYSEVMLRVLQNDGVVVYLNGAEILRSNMPGGAVAFTTQASAEADAWVEKSLSADLLTRGPNVLAVETHQVGPSGPNIGFKLQVQARETKQPPARARDWTLYE